MTGKRYSPANCRKNALLLATAVMAVAALPVNSAARAGEVAAAEWVSTLSEAFTRISNVLARSPEKITSWAPMTRPAGRDVWYPIWSEMGVEARFCNNKLMIFVNGSNAKGIGDNWASLQTAERRLKATSGRIGTITQNGKLTTGQGQSVAIPECMNDDFITSLVPGSIAIMDDVRSGTALASTKTELKRRVDACAAGSHGRGVTYYQKVITQQNEDGSTETSAGEWEESNDRCRTDRNYYTFYTEECRWSGEPPHSKNMSGVNSWKIPVTIDARGKTYGTPEFVSSTCFDIAKGKPADVPEPKISGSIVKLREDKTFSCGAGFTGSYTESRYRDFKTRAFKFAWDENVFSQSRYTKWTDWEETENTCEAFTAVRDDIQGTGNIEYSGCSSVETQNLVKIYTRLDGTEDVVVTGQGPDKTLANVCRGEAKWSGVYTHGSWTAPVNRTSGPCGSGSYTAGGFYNPGGGDGMVWRNYRVTQAHHCLYTYETAVIDMVREDGKRFDNHSTKTCTATRSAPSLHQKWSGNQAWVNYRGISGGYPAMTDARRQACLSSWGYN